MASITSDCDTMHSPSIKWPNHLGLRAGRPRDVPAAEARHPEAARGEARAEGEAAARGHARGMANTQ